MASERFLFVSADAALFTDLDTEHHGSDVDDVVGACESVWGHRITGVQLQRRVGATGRDPRRP